MINIVLEISNIGLIPVFFRYLKDGVNVACIQIHKNQKALAYLRLCQDIYYLIQKDVQYIIELGIPECIEFIARLNEQLDIGVADVYLSAVSSTLDVIQCTQRGNVSVDQIEYMKIHLQLLFKQMANELPNEIWASVLKDADESLNTNCFDAKVVFLQKIPNFGEIQYNDAVFDLDIYAMFFCSLSLEYWFNMMKWQSIIDKKSIRGLVLGMSYFNRGIFTENFSRATVSLAAPSQDLFYDFCLLRYAYTDLPNLEYCLIDLNPYKLWYDLSLSSGNMRCLYYYPQTKNFHHFLNQDIYADCYEKLTRLYNGLFCENFINILCGELHKNDQINEYNIKDNSFADLSEAEKESYQSDVLELFQKPYEETFAENSRLLCQMTEYLITRHIRPIIVIPPFPSVFLKYMDYSMYERTVTVAKTVQLRFSDVLILDFINSLSFNDEYFADWHHLNRKGAELLTHLVDDMLNRI